MNSAGTFTVDLRSDTVTQPTAEMREAMANAAIGDDVLEGDPSALELQALAAEMTDKEAALWFPTGTMCNQAALAVQTKAGDAILLEEEAHILYYEVGAPARISNVLTFTLESDRGTMDPDRVRRRITGENLHTPATTLFCFEDTHNRAGGAVVPLEKIRAYREVADEAGIRVHLDGARVFNAVVAGGGTLKEICANVDSISICLSKGLGAPAGSVLCADAETIDRALRMRKMLGGGMRQIGSICAAGTYALQHNVDRLAQDHARAKRLAEGISDLPCTRVHSPETNMVVVETQTPATEWMAKLEAEGIRCLPSGPHKLRLVTHLHIDDAAIDRTIAAFRKLAA